MPASLNLRATLRAFAPALALAAAGLTVACADAPTGPRAPAAAPQLSESGTEFRVSTLLWTTPAAQASASAAIGSAGGTLTLPGGPTLTVPKGAVSATTTFTITRLPGRIVAYDFQPHGKAFAAALTVKHPAAGTNLAAVAATALKGAYFAAGDDLRQDNAEADVREYTPSTTVASDKSSFSFTVKHFSGYLMSTGRR
jgi:hypothetical protein